MKFVLTSEHVYWWPVKVKLPDPDQKRAGKLIEQEFTIQFAAMPEDEARELAAEIAALPQAEREARQHEAILVVSRGWAGVFDENGEEVPFSAELLREAIRSPFFRLAIYNAYFASTSGEAARKGN